MTTPTPPANHAYKVGDPSGPGILKFGEPGSEADFSCQASEMALEPDKDQEDAVKVLCGGSVAGATTYNWSLTGTLFQDLRTGATEGFTIYTLRNAGKEVPFVFTPNSVESPGFKGVVVIDPTKIGGEVGSKATADIEFAVVGTPQLITV